PEGVDVSSALRKYEKTRRRKVKAVAWVTMQQVSRSEMALRPAALISDRLMTWALTRFLGWVSHRDISTEISRRWLGEGRGGRRPRSCRLPWPRALSSGCAITCIDSTSG